VARLNCGRIGWHIVAAGFSISLIFVSGCARYGLAPDEESQSPIKSRSSIAVNKKNAAQTNRRRGGTRDGSSQQSAKETAVAASILEKWAKVLSNLAPTPQTPPSTTQARSLPSRARQAVYVDILAIAERHPAWRLAEALEEASPRTTTRAIAEIRPPVSPARSFVPQRAVPLPPDDSGRGLLRATLPRGDVSGLTGVGTGFTAGFSRGALPVTVEGLASLQRDVRRRQETSIEQFLDIATSRQAAVRSGREKDLLAAVEEGIEAAQRSNLSTIDPWLPPDPIQLEMTNLRLQLIDNARLTEAERQAAETRLAALEAAWEAQLRRQEAARLAELTRLREERPRQLRREGEERIAAVLDQVGRDDAARREAVLAAHRQRVREEFPADEAVLGIVLPGVALPAQRLPEMRTPPQSQSSARLITAVGRGAFQSPRDRNETLRARIASIGVPAAPTAVGLAAPVPFSATDGGRAAQIRALKARALNESRRWARIAVRGKGWELQERVAEDPKARGVDRTDDVLRILNLS
jgi:hypothetical protein